MRSSTTCTARNARSRAAAALLGLAALAAPWAAFHPPSAAAGEKTVYSCKAQPWVGDEERFVREMLLKWRADYALLSTGELRIYIRDTMVGLQPPGERYEIATAKKGSILFERKDGDIRCTIEKP